VKRGGSIGSVRNNRQIKWFLMPTQYKDQVNYTPVSNHVYTDLNKRVTVQSSLHKFHFPMLKKSTNPIFEKTLSNVQLAATSDNGLEQDQP
jgi:hypothetical protein